MGKELIQLDNALERGKRITEAKMIIEELLETYALNPTKRDVVKERAFAFITDIMNSAFLELDTTMIVEQQKEDL